MKILRNQMGRPPVPTIHTNKLLPIKRYQTGVPEMVSRAN